MGFALGSFASAQLNLDLVTWLMVYAINIKIWLFSNIEPGARASGYFYGALDSSP